MSSEAIASKSFNLRPLVIPMSINDTQLNNENITSQIPYSDLSITFSTNGMETKLSIALPNLEINNPILFVRILFSFIVFKLKCFN
jgi:hypothetical protein